MPEERVESRVLTKTIAGTKATLQSEGIPTLFVGGEGWNSITVGAFTILYNIQTIDLSGYQLQDYTLFPQGILMQDIGTLPRGMPMGIPQIVQRATMVSTTPISEADLIDLDPTGLIWHLPGSLDSTHELDNILMGRANLYLELTTYGGLQQTGTSSWGSGDSTAASKIWLVDAYVVPHMVSLNMYLPDQAFVLPSIIAREPELEYMMRLSRSLEPVY